MLMCKRLTKSENMNINWNIVFEAASRCHVTLVMMVMDPLILTRVALHSCRPGHIRREPLFSLIYTHVTSLLGELLMANVKLSTPPCHFAYWQKANNSCNSWVEVTAPVLFSYDMDWFSALPKTRKHYCLMIFHRELPQRFGLRW
jgi:hypothetical protein